MPKNSNEMNAQLYEKMERAMSNYPVCTRIMTQHVMYKNILYIFCIITCSLRAIVNISVNSVL